MELASIITRMAQNAEAIKRLSGGVGEVQACWKPAPEKWSVMEVICHLYDEEREDFRKRLQLVLNDPSTEWPGIDPQGWVEARRYNERRLDDSVAGFMEERKKSIEWLRGLGSPAWGQTYQHPKLGAISGGDVMASWLAHDTLHIRQLAGLHYQYIAVLAESHSTSYAGPW
jgi:hypothetical protein